MNNIWESLLVGKTYYFDMEYKRGSSRRTQLIEGTIKEKLTEMDGRQYIVLENNTALHLEEISRTVGPF
jgi:hypothetical protein